MKKSRSNLFHALRATAAALVVAHGLAPSPAKAEETASPPPSLANLTDENIKGCLSDLRTLANTISPPPSLPERAKISKSHSLLCMEYSEIEKWALANADGTTKGNKETPMHHTTTVIILPGDNDETVIADISNTQLSFTNSTSFDSETRFSITVEGRLYRGSLAQNGKPPNDDDMPENIRPILNHVANLAARFPELIK